MLACPGQEAHAAGDPSSADATPHPPPTGHEGFTAVTFRRLRAPCCWAGPAVRVFPSPGPCLALVQMLSKYALNGPVNVWFHNSSSSVGLPWPSGPPQLPVTLPTIHSCVFKGHRPVSPISLLENEHVAQRLQAWLLEAKREG